MLGCRASHNALANRNQRVNSICLLLILCSSSAGYALVQPCFHVASSSRRGLLLRPSSLKCSVNGKVSGPAAEGPSVFGRPDVSRYEEFYKESGSEAIEAVAKVVDGQTEHTTNPFYVGYEMEELAMLWDVHTTNYGERKNDDDKMIMNEGAKTSQDKVAGFETDLQLPISGGSNPLKMGLHELILEACRDADEEKSKRDPADPEF
jgi:hypothetical protein